jgi:hypothetical protein
VQRRRVNTCNCVLARVTVRQAEPEVNPRGCASPNLPTHIMTSVSAVFAFPAKRGLRSAKMSKATLAVTPISDKPELSTFKTGRGRDPGPMDHWAERSSAEMFDRRTGRAGVVSLTWGYEWTDWGLSTHAHVASKAGGESWIWRCCVRNGRLHG